tara:strand:+ start:113 stop:307 length:195 start_codon:yes stop_codon:yes gene_type:complete
MKHIFASSSLEVKGNPEAHPSAEELALQDGKSIAELLDETKNKEETAEAKGKDDSRESDRETLS